MNAVQLRRGKILQVQQTHLIFQMSEDFSDSLTTLRQNTNCSEHHQLQNGFFTFLFLPGIPFSFTSEVKHPWASFKDKTHKESEEGR